MELREGVDQAEVGGDDTSREGVKAGDYEHVLIDMKFLRKILKNIKRGIVIILTALIRIGCS